MIKIYYYAVDKDGQGWYYDNPPIWDGESWNVDPKYDSWDQVNDLHSKSSFSFPIPEGFSHTNGYIKFEIDVG